MWESIYTLTTVIKAPKSAKICPQKGTGARPANSITFKPLSGFSILLKTVLIC